MKKSYRAVTLIELMLALVISGMIASALAAFVLSIGKCWGQVSQSQSSAIVANQLSQRLFRRMQDVKRIGFWNEGSLVSPAAMIYWRGDADDSGAIEENELAVLKYDPDGKSLVVYQSASTDEWTTDDLADSGAINRLMSGLTPTPIVHNVVGATLKIEQASDSSVLPTVIWTITFIAPGGSQSTETVSATLRAPGSSE